MEVKRLVVNILVCLSRIPYLFLKHKIAIKEVFNKSIV